MANKKSTKKTTKTSTRKSTKKPPRGATAGALAMLGSGLVAAMAGAAATGVPTQCLLSPGNQVLLRTAVYGWSGRVTRHVTIAGVAFVELEEAAWVADTGRFNEAVAKGPAQATSAEIEPINGLVLVQIASIGDVTACPVLPREIR